MSHHKTIDLDEVAWLMSFGWSAQRISDRLGFKLPSLLKAAHNAGREDIASHLDRSFDYGGITITRADVQGPNAGYRPRKKASA